MSVIIIPFSSRLSKRSVKSASLDSIRRVPTMGTMKKDVHEAQAKILKNLLFRERARFSELNTDGLSTDRFTFHLKQIVESGIAEKDGDGYYRLTPKGKEYANRFDVDSERIAIEKQAKIGVLIIATKMENGQRLYLMQQRLKQPYFGLWGFVTGKIKIGEPVTETAKRELAEETGLSAEPEQKAIYHERIFSKSGELLEDKYFFIFTAPDPKGDLVIDFEGGKNEWRNETEILNGDVFYDIMDLMDLAHKEQLTFDERSYTVERY